MILNESISPNKILKDTVSNAHQECINACLRCFESCTDMIPHCLNMGGEHSSAKHIGLLSVCADICQLSAKALQFETPSAALLCQACAEICDQCARECEQMAGGDQHMLMCAEICRRCADSCKKMMQ